MATTSSNQSGVTLTEATRVSRMVVKYGAISLAVLIVGRVFLTSVIAFWRAMNPPPPPPPTVGFGQLPGIEFPTSGVDAPTNYQLETPNASTPKISDRAKVFLMIRSTPNLLADQRAKEIAAAYDFVFEPEVVSSNTYRWRRPQPISTQLEMNIFNNNFQLKSEYLSRPDTLVNGNLPDDFTAVERVKRFLSSADLLAPDVATSAGEIVYLKSLGGKTDVAFSLSDADYIQVDLNRYPIDGSYRMFGVEGYKGTIHAVVSGSFQGNNSIVAMDFNYQMIDYDQVETYPLRPSSQAWKILQAGEGYVASYDGDGTAVIRKVSLGYFESDQEQEYLQPVYVFEGDDDFIGYVPAISPEYLQTE